MLNELLFIPLGMKDTFYYNIGSISYTVDDDAGTVVGTYASTPKDLDDVNVVDDIVDIELDDEEVA